MPTEPANPICEGITADENIDVEAIVHRAFEAWRRTETLEIKRAAQTISFDSGPICLTALADQHFGSSGVDYPRAFAEAQIVADTPGMWAMTVGDLANQMIIGRLMREQMEQTITIDEEWVLVGEYVKILSSKLVAIIRGNHDGWIQALSGVDYFRSILRGIKPDAIYDTDDCRFVLSVGDKSWRVRVRHKWRGTSIYNQTHGIERAAKWDQDFDIGIGAHTHTGAVSRDFAIGGRDGLALMCGTYKRSDRYAKREGFPASGPSTAVSAIFYEDGTVLGLNNLERAAELMRQYYG